MNKLILPISCLAAGIGIGLAVSPSQTATTEKTTSKKVVKRTENSTEIGQRASALGLDLIQRSHLPQSIFDSSKTPSEWADLISAQVESPLDIDSSAGDLLTLLVPVEDIPEVIELLENRPRKLNIWSVLQQNSRFKLLKRFYHLDPDAAKSWVLASDEDRRPRRILALVDAMVELEPEEAIELYKQYPNSLTSVETVSTSLKLSKEFAKHRSVEEFWEFYDEFPSAQRRMLDFSIGSVITEGNFAEHYKAYKKRTGDQNFFGGQNGGLLQNWANKDAESYIDWYKKESESFKNQEATEALMALSHSASEVAKSHFQKLLRDDPKVLDSYIAAAVLGDIHSPDPMVHLKESLSKLPEGTKIEGKHVKAAMQNAQWAGGAANLFDYAELISDRAEQFNVTKDALQNVMVSFTSYSFGLQMNEGDYRRLNA